MTSSNFDRFRSFSIDKPFNVAEQAGATAEELALSKGSPAKHLTKPEFNPMFNPSWLRATLQQLARAGQGSDRGRIEQLPGSDNPYEGPAYQLSQSRAASQKLGGEIFAVLPGIIPQQVRDPNVQKLMRDSLQRVLNLRKMLERYNAMGVRIEARRLSHSKG